MSFAATEIYMAGVLYRLRSLQLLDQTSIVYHSLGKYPGLRKACVPTTPGERKKNRLEGSKVESRKVWDCRRENSLGRVKIFRDPHYLSIHVKAIYFGSEGSLE